MNFGDHILIILGIAALCLVLLALRELLKALSHSSGHPDRILGFFNACVVLALAGGIFYGSLMLVAHKEELEKEFPLYARAHYAPEREPLSPGKNWIYVTHDNTADIIGFYRNVSGAGYQLTENIATGTTRLLLTKGNIRMFVTIEDAHDSRIIYYSHEGSVQSVP